MSCRNNASRRLSVALLALLFAGAAAALPEDRNQPIKVTADNAVQDVGTVTYRGAVVIVQGTLQINADTVVINHVEGRVQKLTAKGKPARLQQQPEPDSGLVHAAALTLIYYQSENRIELLREARVERDGSTVNGDHIEYLIDSETVRARGEQGGGNRVEMVLQPDTPAAETAPERSAPATPAEETQPAAPAPEPAANDSPAPATTPPPAESGAPAAAPGSATEPNSPIESNSQTDELNSPTDEPKREDAP